MSLLGCLSDSFKMLVIVFRCHSSPWNSPEASHPHRIKSHIFITAWISWPYVILIPSPKLSQISSIIFYCYYFPCSILTGNFSASSRFLSGPWDSSQILHVGTLLRIHHGSFWGCALPNRHLGCGFWHRFTKSYHLSSSPSQFHWAAPPDPPKKNYSLAPLGLLSPRLISANSAL